MNTRIGIIIPCLKYFQGVVELIESIKTTHDYRVYVIDNWRENRGCSAAWNLGCERAIAEGCTHLLICNDDILLAPATIDNLMEYALRAGDDIALVSAMNLRGQLDNAYDILKFEGWREWAETSNDGPDFSCFMITPKTFEEIGKFDTGFFPAYFEDNDYHYRIKVAGKRAVCLNRAPYYHWGSKTQNLDPNAPVVTGEAFERNRAYFVQKWGGDPGKEAFKTPFGEQKAAS